MKIFKSHLPIMILLLPCMLTSSEIDEQIKDFISRHHEVELPNPFSKQFPKLITYEKSLYHDNKLSLEAIISQKAYINKQWVKSGDKILTYRIIDISPTEVIVLNHITKKRQTLTFTKGPQ